MQLVFVHLGKTIPRYLARNLQRTRVLFPDADITLVRDSTMRYKLNSKIGIRTVHYDVSDQMRRLQLKFPKMMRNSKFRNDYWLKTFVRLMALETAHKTLPLERMLHLESDVLIFSKFPFQDLTEDVVAWLEHNQTGDIASLLYSSDYERTLWLTHELLRSLAENPKHTDMTALKSVRSMNPGVVKLFPRFPEESGKSEFLRVSSNVLFDGAQFGQWILGGDPRNNWGIRNNKVWSGGSENPLVHWFFSLRDNNLYLQTDSDEFLVCNLHVHSKEYHFFKYLTPVSLRLNLHVLRKNRLNRGFSPSAFFQFIWGIAQSTTLKKKNSNG
jgi:hypothetical protein